MSSLEEQNTPLTNARAFQQQLDLFESRLSELKIQYEQYFCNLIPLQPEKEHKELKIFSRQLLRAPFKNSQTNFRLRNLIMRFQTLNTYWERILKQKEDGSYRGDKFRGDMRSKAISEIKNKNTKEGKEDHAIKELFETYRGALNNSGLKSDSLHFDQFKKDLKNKASLLLANKSGAEVSFRVEVQGGKVSIKAKIE